MAERRFIGRLFLVGGVILAAASAALWWWLPIRMALPPYVVSPALALLYGLFCLWPRRATGPVAS